MHIDYRLTLRRLTDALLQPDAPHQQWLHAAEQLYDLFSVASQLRADEPAHRTDIVLPSGKALAPAWAAMCIKDFYRTRQFLRGMVLGIQSARNTFPHTPIHVLYAGTGPFATLALPLTTLFSPDEVQFTLIEINPISAQLLQEVVAVFWAQGHVRAIVQADATTYQACSPVHLVVTETMQQALQEEPQVAITQNLAAQIEKGGFLIPRQITVHAGLFNLARSFEENNKDEICRLLYQVFELSDKTPLPDSNGAFPEVMVDIPQDNEPEFSQFCLFTDIQVFGDVCLRMGESGLTQPKVLLQRGKDGAFGAQKIALQYVLHHKPGFRIRTVSKE